MTQYKINSIKDITEENKANWLDICRQVFPKASDMVLDNILWNRTGFPHFYYGDDPVSYFIKQLEEFKIAANNWDGDPNTKFDFYLDWDEVKGEYIKIPRVESSGFET